MLNQSLLVKNKSLALFGGTVILFLGIVSAVAVGNTRVVREEVTLMRTPNGDIFHVRKAPGVTEFSRPIRVNSVPGSAVAIGSVRGAQIAIGKGGRVHLAWLGSSTAQPRGPNNATPMHYARVNDAGTAFEP
jgi:hypothetical protein